MTERILNSKGVFSCSDGMNAEKDGGGKGENTKTCCGWMAALLGGEILCNR